MILGGRIVSAATIHHVRTFPIDGCMTQTWRSYTPHPAKIIAVNSVYILNPYIRRRNTDVTSWLHSCGGNINALLAVQSSLNITLPF